jgi:hypothetical protein
MSYFVNFPDILYRFNISGKDVLLSVKDIALNVRVRKHIVENITLYDEYDIEDDERLEIISEKLYGKDTYHWILMLINEKYDYIRDYPLNQEDLEKKVQQIYGEGNEFAQHYLNGVPHYTNLTGDIVQKMTQEQFEIIHPGKSYQEYLRTLSPVSNYDYEDDLNESKRRIKVVNANMVAKLAKELQDLMGES